MIETFRYLLTSISTSQGLIRIGTDKCKRDDDAESEVEDADGGDSEEGSDSEELDDSSDDSSSETDEPRRKPDIDLLENLDTELRINVNLLRSKIPGCPVQECLKALDTHKTVGAAQKWLMLRFGYTELDTLDADTKAIVERLIDEMPFDLDVLECIQVLRSSRGDYDRARKGLQWMYGDRQKIFMVGWG